MACWIWELQVVTQPLFLLLMTIFLFLQLKDPSFLHTYSHHLLDIFFLVTRCNKHLTRRFGVRLARPLHLPLLPTWLFIRTGMRKVEEPGTSAKLQSSSSWRNWTGWSCLHGLDLSWGMSVRCAEASTRFWWTWLWYHVSFYRVLLWLCVWMCISSNWARWELLMVI